MMKVILFICFILMSLLFGCGKNEWSLTPSFTPASSIQPKSTPTQIPIKTPSTPFITPTSTGLIVLTPVITSTFSSEARLKLQCLNPVTTILRKISSGGTVILESRSTDKNGFLKPDTFLLDMKTGTMQQIALKNENQTYHLVSPDRSLFAYLSSIYNLSKQLIKEELVIASSDGKRQVSVPWEKGWVAIPAWRDNQHLLINVAGLDPEENAGRKAASILILNPYNGERSTLIADLPKFLNTPSTILPWWEGRSGVVYDPSLAFAVYPRFIGNYEEMYTYGIWDLQKKQLVASLENIFTASSLYNDTYPMPLWSPDGSQFIFRGGVENSDKIEFELYLVNQDGKIAQITHLNPIVYPVDSDYSWSPDGRYVALFLHKWQVLEDKASVAVIDTITQEVTDYCVQVSYGGEGYGGGLPPSPIWSPDGKQFLVSDWYTRDHQRVILFDITREYAAYIAEDMEPTGWMTSKRENPHE